MSLPEHARNSADHIAIATGLTTSVALHWLSMLNVVLATLTGLFSLFFLIVRFLRWRRGDS